MIKTSKFTLDPGEVELICAECNKEIIGELAESSIKPGYMHFWCASSIEDNMDYMAFMDDARDYARQKEE